MTSHPLPPTPNGLPAPAVKLARRAAGLLTEKGTRTTFEIIIASDGRWLLIVNGGTKVEELGR